MSNSDNLTFFTIDGQDYALLPVPLELEEGQVSHAELADRVRWAGEPATRADRKHIYKHRDQIPDALRSGTMRCWIFIGEPYGVPMAPNGQCVDTITISMRGDVSPSSSIMGFMSGKSSRNDAVVVRL